MTVTWDLERFVEAQRGTFRGALQEIQAGHKVGHWIWWIFPQLRGLGSSHNATYYGLSGAGEARAYLEHPLLGSRLRECVTAVMLHASQGASGVLGPDSVKLRSSLTLFARVSAGDALFHDALAKLYGSEEDPLTVSMLEGARGDDA
jgi:uncharacterized protein (DUF1810 family)